MPSNTENKIRKTLLTPCRRVGLKRKSIGNTSNTSFDLIDSPSPLPHVSNTIVNNSLADSDSANITPIRQGIQKSSFRSGKKLKILQHTAENQQTLDSNDDNFKLEVRECTVDNIPTLKPAEEITKVSDYEEDQENDDIDSQIEKIEKKISEKKMAIEKLEMNAKNVKQHNLTTLNSLIIKWRRACQTALKDLSYEYQNQDKNLTMSILLNQLNIPCELVRYSETEMDFQD